MRPTEGKCDAMEKNILAGTYHKTGSVWVYRTLRALSRAIGADFLVMSKQAAGWTSRDEMEALYGRHLETLGRRRRRAIFFDGHSMFPGGEILNDFNGFRVIRDPRDIILSAISHHQRSDEKWLHVRKKEWGGMTYAEKLAALGSLDEKIDFELDNSAGRVIARMAAFDAGDRIRTMRYEDLITDRDMERWTALFESLGLSPAEVGAGREAVWNNSLFGALADKDIRHVSDGRVAQWKSKLSAAQVAHVHRRVGAEIARLGYDV